MGIYERDYYQGEQSGIQLGGPRTMVATIILINVAVYLVQILTRQGPLDVGWFTDTFKMHGDLLQRPWLFYQLLTYGFLHAPFDLWHILMNMAGLWFLGREVESLYGRREFLWLYLSAIVFAGLIWVAAENVAGLLWVAADNVDGQASPPPGMLGASGGVVAVVLLFILNFPRRTLMLFPIPIPIPAWVVGVGILAYNLFGAAGGNQDSNVAFTAHLGGAFYAYIFFRTRWSLLRLVPGGLKAKLRRGPRLRVHSPQDREEKSNQQVDEILKKIQQHGQESLTRKERRILEEASRRYQDRRDD